MVAWTSLILICFLIGTAILQRVKADRIERIGDRFILAVWLGVVILSISLLAVSLVLPLSLLVGMGVTAILVAIALRSAHTKTEILSLRSFLSTRWILVLITLEFFVAAYTSREINYYDTALYHFQAIQWLSRFGVVPGLALIHSRFGFISSWLTLAAPFNTGIFEARIGALTGGFSFLLAILHALISFARIWQNRGRFEDWFIVILLFLCLPIISSYAMPISPTPDLPIIVLTVVITWAIIILSTQLKTEPTYLVNAKLISLILSTGALTMKLSALPLLVVSGLFYIIGRKWSIRRIVFCSIISFLLLLPVLGFGIITSGCPLYPSSLMCLDLPWSLGAENAKEMAGIIQNWARWTGSTPTNANSWNWLGHWIKSEARTAFLLVCSFLSSVVIVRRLNKSQVRGQNYVLALAGLGAAFMMYGAPSLRFGGYLCILPAWLIATYCITEAPGMAAAVVLISVMSNMWLELSMTGLVIWASTLISGLVIWLYPHKISHKAFFIILFFFISIIPLRHFIASPNLQAHLLLPPKMQAPKVLLNKQANDIKYVVPDASLSKDQCWAAELPCTPSLTYEDIKLRDPERGIGGGFVRN